MHTVRAGHDVWEVRDPVGGVVPTATVVNDTVWVGGGFNSTSFYGIRAATGEVTSAALLNDNGAGPVSAADDAIAYTSESCTLYSADATTGKVRWSKWLGDPLVSHPAVASNVIYLVAPTDLTATTHTLFAFDAHTGQERWRVGVGPDAIGGPVVNGDAIYVATQDGALSRFDREGHLAWTEPVSATSAPVVAGSTIFVAVRRDKKGAAYEGILRLEQSGDGSGRPELARSWHIKLAPFSAVSRDAQDGFGEGMPRFQAAREHLGSDQSQTLWSWQGARPVLAGDRVFAVLDGKLVALAASDGREVWSAPRASAPPAVRGGRVFVPTTDGSLEIHDVEKGHTLETIPLGGTAATFPPVLDRDRVIVSTNDGRVVSIAVP
ncbi:MAG TPA: PQQ-binding-like beta-propeller repeat protein [Polyangiaceae bacterium]|nr:PQQ-binding-like beta-propeller repeat protein [Polyangiaceae bacterium]